MLPISQKQQRVITVIAGTVIALACGTNYAYSAWGPQFAHRLKLSSKESNLIGAAGNLGMYASGIPFGLLVDSKGPRLAIIIGAFCVGGGYYPIYLAYKNGDGWMPIPLILLFTFLTGMGGASAFGGAIKAAATNFPEHRGTATAFPLAAFGLSAFVFSVISSLAFKDDTGQFLLLMSMGGFLMIMVSAAFVHLIPVPPTYTVLRRRSEDQVAGAHPSHRSRSNNAAIPAAQPLMHTSAFESTRSAHSRSHSTTSNHALGANLDENSSLMSSPESPRPSTDSFVVALVNDDPADSNESIYPDVRGMALLKKPEFWQLFCAMGLLSGIGLMTINNIGNDAKALWKYYDKEVDSRFVQQRQVMHVSILSIGSFVGRLLSGVGSDILVKKLHLSRFWCLFLSAVVFTLTQIAGASISDPNHLIIVSSFTGLAYGFLFGVFPSLTAHTFGIHGLSQNWGVMTLAPVFSGNIFNMIYGTIYDHHSIIAPTGERECLKGLSCYRTAYLFTFFSGIAGIAVCLGSILREKRIQKEGGRARSPSKVGQHERIA